MVAIVLCAVYMAALQGDIVGGVRAGLGFRRAGIDQRLSSGHRDFAVDSNESGDNDTFPRRDVNDVSYGPITVEQLDLPSSSFTVSHTHI
jgi:hypothetical protein